MKNLYLTTLFVFITYMITFPQGSPNDLPTSISNNTQTISLSSGENYINSFTYLKEFSSHPSTLKTGDASPEIQYFDGLGRNKQNVSVMASLSGKDIVTPVEYDSYGRQAKSYLPYAKTSSNYGAYTSLSTSKNELKTFLGNIYNTTDDDYGFAEKGFDGSPLNRIEEQGSPGASWQLSAHPAEYEYKINTSSIQSWKYTGTSYSSFYYSSGKLYLKETTDEDNKVIKEYIDVDGKIIQKEINGTKTRYCYDQFDLLRCVIQPQGTSPASTSFCFYYKYDGKQRLAEKTIPGAYDGTDIYYIYDARDRLVLSQDANQRAKSPDEWTYYVYDDMNRPVDIGTWATSTTRSSLESTMSSASNLDYIENITSKVPLKYLHHDNYTSLPSGNNYYTTDATTLGVTKATNNTGRLTWTEAKALDYETGMDYWITSAFYYDKYGQLIQSVSDNHLNGKNYITNKYNFAGQVIRTYHRHVADGTTTTLDQNFDFDHRGRHMKTRYKINGGTETLLTAHNYNEAGEMVDKYLHSQSGGNFLQKMDYEYNIRGWMTKINDPTSFSENDKFGLQLYYNSAPTGGTALYNGNISGMKWGTPNNSNMLYRFSYDNINRLSAADFYNTGYSSTAYDASYAYNSNGNLTSIDRYGSSGSLIDDLTIGHIGNCVADVSDYAYDVAGVVDYTILFVILPNNK